MNGQNVFADGVLEPLRGTVAFTVGAGPSLAANTVRTAFMDSVGQSAAGGIALVQGDYSLSGGLIPSGIGYEVAGLTCWWHQSDFTAVPPDITVLGLSSNIWVQMMYANQLYDLGLLASYLGPYGSPTGLNNVPFPRRFGWPWMAEDKPLELEPGKQFWLQFTTLRAITAGVAVGTWQLRIEMPARRIAQGVAAVKQ